MAPEKCPNIAALLCFLLRRLIPNWLARSVSRRKRRLRIEFALAFAAIFFARGNGTRQWEIELDPGRTAGFERRSALRTALRNRMWSIPERRTVPAGTIVHGVQKFERDRPAVPR
jgi:hypothetical protein